MLFHFITHKNYFDLTSKRFYSNYLFLFQASKMHAVLQRFGENASTNFEATVDAGEIRTFDERTRYPHAIHRLIT